MNNLLLIGRIRLTAWFSIISSAITYHNGVNYCLQNRMSAIELRADELVVGGGVGWSYDRRRRRAAHFSSAAAA